jgi:hypothetical protein
MSKRIRLSQHLNFTARVISGSGELRKREVDMASFLRCHSDNPFLLGEFIDIFTQARDLKQNIPLVIMLYADDNIQGIAPLAIHKRFGLASVQFLEPSYFSPDLVFANENSQRCAEDIVHLLFKKMNTHILDLTFEADSPNLSLITQQFKRQGIRFLTQQSERHSILRTSGTWEEFSKSRGRNFRKKMKKIVKHLKLAGSWRIVCFENENITPEVIKKVFDVEETSWKQEWRARRGQKVDSVLEVTLKASQRIRENEAKFNWRIVFLELNSLPIAYILILEYMNVAYFVKTSYDAKYRQLYPGIYVMNEAIRGYFGTLISRIDFIADLPFHETWTTDHLQKVRVVATKGLIPALALSSMLRLENMFLTTQNNRMRKVRTLFAGSLD